MINNNNNNQFNNQFNNKNEIIFWKVFKNKFLLYTILKKVQNVRWVIHKEPNEMHACNRMKFKNIISLGWMIEKKLLKLLKYKIEKNEYIQIDLKSIKQLFNEISSTSLSKKEEINLEKQEKELLLNEILIELILKFKIEFNNFDLIKIAIECNSIKVLQLLYNNKELLFDHNNNFEIYPSTIELAIKKSSPLVVLKLFEFADDNKSIIDKTIIENSIYWSNKNYKYTEEMLQLVLFDKPELHCSIALPTIKNQTKEEELKKFDFSTFIRFKSLAIKNKLLDLNYIRHGGTKEQLFLGKLKSYETILFEYKVYKKLVCKQDKLSDLIEFQIYEIENSYTITILEPELKLKKLLKLIILDTGLSTLYIKYIIKYKETINEFKYDGGLSDFSISLNDNSIYSNYLNLYRFITITQKISTFILAIANCQNEFKNTIEKHIENENYYPILNFIKISKTSCSNSSFYNKIGGFDNFYLNITNREIIDWIFKIYKSNPIITTFIKELIDSNRFKIESIELINYFLKKNDTNSKYQIFQIKNQLLFKSIWRKSIQECNIEQLKIINSMIHCKNINFSNDSNFEFSKENDFILQDKTNPKDLLKLIEYLNAVNFNGFSFSMFSKFLDEILKYQESHQPLFKIEILNLKSFSNELINQLLSTSVSRLNLTMFKLLINNIEKLSILNQMDHYNFRFLSSEQKYIFGECENEIYHTTLPKNINSNSIIDIIKFLISKYLYTRNYKFQETQVLDSFLIFINYFFEKLIQLKSIDIELLISIYKILLENEITIQHSMYNSFFYLHIRDARLSKYILSRPMVQFPIQMGPNVLCAPQYFDTTIEYKKGSYHLRDYLLPEKYTFDFIFKKSLNGQFENDFDTLLNCLINDLTPNSIYKDMEPFSINLNSNLEYLLEIRRQDLFFEKLKSINQPRDQEIKFYFSFKTVQLIVVLLDLDSIGKVLEINLNQLPTLYKEIFKQSIWLGYYNVTKFILDNFQFDQFKSVNQFPFTNEKMDTNYRPISPYKYDRFLEFKFLFENYSHLLPANPTQELFEKSINTGCINLTNLILKYYENFDFKFTKFMISNAINNNQLHIVKYYFNQFIKKDNELLLLVENLLLKHSDYIYYVNWLILKK